jgi:hypothetical protein
MRSMPTESDPAMVSKVSPDRAGGRLASMLWISGTMCNILQSGNEKGGISPPFLHFHVTSL